MRAVVSGNHTCITDQADLSRAVPRALYDIPADTSARSLEHERIALTEDPALIACVDLRMSLLAGPYRRFVDLRDAA